jgi:hypothetical protein
MLRNGSFRVWQRGTSFSSPVSLTYTADGWFIAKTGSAWVYSIERIAHPTIPGRYGLRFNVTTGDAASNTMNLRQALGRVSLLDNETVRVSFKYKSNAAFSAGIRIMQHFGTGGAPSSAVFTSQSFDYVDTAGALAPAGVTIAVPTIVGKTIGSNGDDFVALTINFPVDGSTYDVSIFDVQVEPGTITTPFEDYRCRPLALELELCKRHFERIGGPIADTHFGKGFADSATHGLFDLYYTEKRTVPTITVTGGDANFEVQRQGSAVVATTALTASHIGLRGCQLDATVASGLTAGEGLGLKAKSTSGTIDVSAELT